MKVVISTEFLLYNPTGIKAKSTATKDFELGVRRRPTETDAKETVEREAKAGDNK